MQLNLPNWKDNIVEKPLTYRETKNEDGTITLTPAFGAVGQEGTSLDSTNMNMINNALIGINAEVGMKGRTVLWSGTLINANDTIALQDNINNYDRLEFISYFGESVSSEVVSNSIYVKSQSLSDAVDSLDVFITTVKLNVLNNGTNLKMEFNKTVKVINGTSTKYENTNYGRITKIYGIKY